MQTGSLLYVLETGNFNTLSTYGAISSPCRSALSRDGSIFVSGGLGEYRVFQRNGSGGYSLRVTRNLAGALTFVTKLSISEDGSRLAASYMLGDSHALGVECLDLPASFAAGAPVVSMSDTLVGSGALQNVPSGLEISQDGSIVALSVWGDGISVPEINIYDSNQSNPVMTDFLGKSVMDIDLSPDGKHLAVNHKDGHANQLVPGKFLKLYDIGQPDLLLRGAPQLGSSVAFRHRTNPGAPAILLSSASLASSPETFPGVGTLFLRRIDLSFLPMGNANAAGIATLAQTIPNDLALLGSSLYYQGYSSAPRRLGEDWVKVTLLP